MRPSSEHDLALLSKKEKELTELKSQLDTMKMHNKELKRSIEQVKSSSKLTEDKFYESQMYKKLIEEAKLLSD